MSEEGRRNTKEFERIEEPDGRYKRYGKKKKKGMKNTQQRLNYGTGKILQVNGGR